LFSRLYLFFDTKTYSLANALSAHYNQGAVTGALANKLTELGNAISAFVTEMSSTWNNTTILVISEFGRTIKENGSKGTDHGHGTTYWVISGKETRAMENYKKTSTKDIALHQNRDYPTYISQQDILKEILLHP